MKLTIEQIKNWEKEYPTMKGVVLTKREKELLEGADIKSHEGMLFGRMYADWKEKSRQEDKNEVEENMQNCMS